MLRPQLSLLSFFRVFFSDSFHFFCVRSAEGGLYCWGRGRNGRLGLGHDGSVNVPSRVTIPGDKQVRVGLCDCV